MKLLDRPFNNEKCTQKQEEIRLEEERTNQLPFIEFRLLV
jgi:hypothetical protein